MNPADRKYKLGYLVSHPIQYQAPLLRKLSEQDDIDLNVMFLSDFSIKAFVDKEFHRTIEWDTPLTDGYQHIFLPGRYTHTPPTFIRPYIKHLKDILLSSNLDALWVHGWYNLNYLRAINIAHANGIPVMVRGEANLHMGEKSGLRKFLKDRMMYWLLKRVSGFLSIGSWNREFYRSYGVSDDAIYDVPYAVDNHYFQDVVKKSRNDVAAIKSELNLEDGRPVILYASKLTRRKRILDLLVAYKRLSVDGNEPDPYLLIIGDGELYEEVTTFVRDTGWDSIKLLGFKNQSELAKYYSLCDIFVLPSKSEPWGLVVNEAMNAGVAVIVTDEVGCGKDIVRHGKNGYIYKAGDVDSLRENLKILCDNRSLLEDMKQEGRGIINNWGYDQDVAGIRSALREICK